jgi:hypothetical protein
MALSARRLVNGWLREMEATEGRDAKPGTSRNGTAFACDFHVKADGNT